MKQVKMFTFTYNWRMAKRGVDVIASLIGLIVVTPILVTVSLAILVTMGRPVLFRQRRPGLHSQLFEMIKFRTMTAGSGPDGDRITWLGRILRRTSLDELPELWNVLRGEMSLVGPRPLLEEYLDIYSPEQGRRHDVRPGLTGWAQVHGRNELAWGRRFELDVWYVDNHSLLIDAKILLLTIQSVVAGTGVQQSERATVDKFRGEE